MDIDLNPLRATLVTPFQNNGPKSNPPRLSVLLPCRNAAHTLYAALHSVLAQSHADFEVLLLNDGSTDDSFVIAESFHDPRIRLLGDTRQKGISYRLNQGIQAARGHYIARMDADDLCFPHRFEQQIAYLETHPEIDLLGCRAVVFRADGTIIGLLPYRAEHSALCAQPWRNIPLPHPTWMGKRSWFLRHLYPQPEVHRAEDQELLLRSYQESHFACLDEVLLAYRQGNYRLKQTLVARHALLRAQLGLFTERGQWRNAALSISLTALKIFIDVLAALPGSSALFFMRMRSTVPSATQQLVHDTIQAAEQNHPST